MRAQKNVTTSAEGREILAYCTVATCAFLIATSFCAPSCLNRQFEMHFMQAAQIAVLPAYGPMLLPSWWSCVIGGCSPMLRILVPE